MNSWCKNNLWNKKKQEVFFVESKPHPALSLRRRGKGSKA
jgi:hypothetical protein